MQIYLWKAKAAWVGDVKNVYVSLNDDGMEMEEDDEGEEEDDVNESLYEEYLYEDGSALR